MSGLTKHDVSVINLYAGDEGDYAARCLRTKVLREHAAREVAIMLRSFVPDGYEIEIKRDHPVTGEGGTRLHPVVATLGKWEGIGDQRRGCGAHFFVTADTVNGALCKLLAIILDGHSFYPMT